MACQSANAPNFLISVFPPDFAPDLLEKQVASTGHDFFCILLPIPTLDLSKSTKAGGRRARDSELQGLAVAAGRRGWWLLGALRSAGAGWPAGGQTWWLQVEIRMICGLTTMGGSRCCSSL